MDDTDALLKIWVAGWAASRGSRPPQAHGPGWRVEVGGPQQLRRHVFPRDDGTLRELAETVTEPWVWLKACMHHDDLRALLPPRWTPGGPSWFMRFDGRPPAAVLASGYALRGSADGNAHMITVVAEDGTPAAEGRVVMVGDHAIFDRIGTDAAHRRRGLGRALMAALHAHADARGAVRGLLAATPDGHALYKTLGWTVQSPYSGAVIEGPPAG